MKTEMAMDEFKIGHAITGILAGAISLLFNKYPRTRVEKFRAFFIVAGGAVTTAFLTPLLLAYFKWMENAEYGVAFILGLFGMGVLEGIYKVVQAFVVNPIETLEKIKKAWRGEP